MFKSCIYLFILSTYLLNAWLLFPKERTASLSFLGGGQWVGVVVKWIYWTKQDTVEKKQPY